MNPRGPITAIAALLLFLFLWPLSASMGQSGASTGTGEVSLQVAQFGLSGAARPGDWVGIELKVTDSGAQPRNVLLRIEIPDGDGDGALMRRVVVANPGITQSAWLYARLPFNTGAGTTYRVTAHEAIDEGDGVPDESGARYVPGRMLASLAFPIPNGVHAWHGLIGIIGGRAAGLDQYSTNILTNGGFAPTGHEFTEVVRGMLPANMPDRWHGLMAFEALVWTGAATDEQSLRLSAPQADAIREWVERGGHLIVVLPPAGQSWVDVPGNPLAAIVPDVTVERNDGVDLDDYRQLLSRRADVALPNNAVVQTFTPRQGSERFNAIPILDTPDGKTVVVRRLVGTGAVTLIGLDLTTRPVSDVSGALHADLFWHRVLGKRLPLMSHADFLDEQQPPPPPGSTTAPPSKWLGGRSEADLDAVIGPAITKSAKAAAGLLLAFVIFLLYWLLAGPVGFYALKERNLKHYSWLGFVAAAGLFTAIAWGGANVLRSRNVEGQHLTFVDHVYGQSNQRMRSWFTLLLPRYGTQRVAIGEAKDVERWRHTLSSWDSGGSGGSGLASFPDARPYEVDARSPWRLDVPARATTKTFQADWAGGLPGNWGMITPHTADGSSAGLGDELQLTRDPESPTRWKLSGTLTHSLPSGLEDVTIIVVAGQDPLPVPRNSRIAYSDGRLQANAWAFAAPGNKAWLPGAELDLATATGSDGSAARLGIDALLAKVVPPTPVNFGGQSPAEIALRNVPESLTALALFGVIQPPNPSVTNSQTLARRSAAHTYDLGRWFTQPCIIVIGQLSTDAQGNGIETPLPVTIDGSAPDSTRKHILGRTVIRWVYPLPAVPPKYSVSPLTIGGLGTPAEGTDTSEQAPPTDDPAPNP